MKMYWPVLPVNVSMSRLHLVGGVGAKLADHVELPVAELAVGLTSFMSPTRVFTPFGSGDVRLAAIEHRDLVASGDIQFDARQRNLSGAADIENAECHGSSAPSVVRRSA